MNTRMKTDLWISRTVLVLILILASSVGGILILMATGQPMPELLVALGFVATGSLIRMFASPLTPKLME